MISIAKKRPPKNLVKVDKKAAHLFNQATRRKLPMPDHLQAQNRPGGGPSPRLTMGASGRNPNRSDLTANDLFAKVLQQDPAKLLAAGQGIAAAIAETKVVVIEDPETRALVLRQVDGRLIGVAEPTGK